MPLHRIGKGLRIAEARLAGFIGQRGVMLTPGGAEVAIMLRQAQQLTHPAFVDRRLIPQPV